MPNAPDAPSDCGRSGKHGAIDVVDDVVPPHDVRVGVRLDHAATRVSPESDGDEWLCETDGAVTWVTVSRVAGHQRSVFA